MKWNDRTKKEKNSSIPYPLKLEGEKKWGIGWDGMYFIMFHSIPSLILTIQTMEPKIITFYSITLHYTPFPSFSINRNIVLCMRNY